MANNIGVLTNQEIAIYSDNLVNDFLTFPSVFTWNIVSGGANGVPENNIVNAYAGTRSLLTTFTDTGELVFNSGGTETDITIAKDGTYIISYRFFKDLPIAICDYTISIYVNGILFDYNTFEQTLSTANNFVDDKWNTFFQYLTLVEDDVVSFAFATSCDTVGAKVSLGGIKLELIDRALSLPSLYSKPLPIIIENSQTIDIGSIGSNSSVVVVATVTGAIVGDFVQMTYPVDLITVDLSVSYPIVTDVDEVSFIVHNKSGGSVNPASGDFTFKIVR